MPRVAGFDPGTLGLDLCGLDDGRLFLDVSTEPAAAPTLLVERLVEAGPLDLVVAPSGYGLPLTDIAELDEARLGLLLLVREADRGLPERVAGLRQTLRLLRERGLPAVVIPAVVHLPTVPAHRKVNRVDMGTTDKLCVAALAIRDQARRLGLGVTETRFLLLEWGGAFTAALAVEGGAVVDGIGGTGGGLGHRALGALDGEVAYLLGRVGKSTLFSGGAATVAGDPDLTPEDLAERAARDPRVRLARDALVESAAKLLVQLEVSVPRPREMLVSGRLARVPALVAALAERLGARAPVRRVEGLGARVKEAAQGAALLADGLAGGAHRDLVDALRLREARGSVLDHVHVPGVERLRRQFGLS